MNKQLNEFLKTDRIYIEKCTSKNEKEFFIEYFDDKIPDMYTHNFLYLKNKIEDEKLIDLIEKEIAIRKNEKTDFLRIEIDFDYNTEIFNKLSIKPDVSIIDYMYIETENFNDIKNRNDAIIKVAHDEKTMQDGIEVDIIANSKNIGKEFAEKRINRKAEIYRDSIIDFFVCYNNNLPVGNCEFMINKDIAKLEDFDIIESYQRKGFGSSVIKYLLKEAFLKGVKYLYLITEADDTAKEMYKKCGMKKIGEKMELFFDL
jgi:spore maturation protein CgeE